MNTIQFDKKLTCGKDFVAVEVLDVMEEMKVGHIYLPNSHAENGRLAHCKVTNVGVGAKEKLGIEVGDYVMIDRLSTFAWTAPSAVLKYDSVIAKTNEDKSEYFPLKDCAFIEPDEKSAQSEVNGIIVLNYDKRLNTGTIVKKNFDKNEEYPFDVGDKVMLVKGGDLMAYGDVKVYIWKKDMIICTIEDK